MGVQMSANLQRKVEKAYKHPYEPEKWDHGDWQGKQKLRKWFDQKKELYVKRKEHLDLLIKYQDQIDYKIGVGITEDGEKFEIKDAIALLEDHFECDEQDYHYLINGTYLEHHKLKIPGESDMAELNDEITFEDGDLDELRSSFRKV